MRSGTISAERRQPLFNEIRDRLLAEISGGRLAVGMRLPSEPELALNLQISRPTLREVLRSLEADGIVSRVHGVGTFVARKEPLVRTALDLDVGVTEAVAAANATLGIEIVRIANQPAPPWAGSALGLAPDDPVLHVERIIRANGVPAVHGVDVIPLAVTETAKTTYDGGSVYRYLEHDCGIELAGGIAEVTAVSATAHLARCLGTRGSTPLLRLDQVEKETSGRPVLFSREHYAPGVFGLMVRRTRNQRADLTADEVDVIDPRRPDVANPA